MAIHIALSLALIGSLALAAVLLAWAERVSGARLLVAFLCGVAAWIAGNELPTWFGPGVERPALLLMATAALTSVVFLHFTLAFTRTVLPPAVLRAAYALAAAALVVSALVRTGSFQPFAGIALMAMPNWIGLGVSAVWAVAAAAGQAVLLRAMLRQRGAERRQVAAVTASSAWGLLTMAGYGVAALHLPIYPWPLLLLPAYPVILVYGILRYRVFVANAWARRALVWSMLAALALLIIAVVPLMPFAGSRFVSGLVVALASLTLAVPARRLAEQIIYPGGQVSAEDLTQWRAALATADTLPGLADRAAATLSARLAVPVSVSIAPMPPAAPPSLHCAHGATTLIGWDAAPPGRRRLADLFGAVLAEEAARLERAAALAERERERQTQARLAELGALATTVAHDVRNPLNIISMAAAAAPAEVRQDITEQVGRIARLAQDLLDYAKPWRVEPVRLDLAAYLRARVPGVSGPDAAFVHADPRRLDQAVTNLLDNARAASERIGVEIEADPQTVRLHVCDAGPGVPVELRDSLFQPFVSRTPGGTGLGLAIVARVMQAHGGDAALTERPGWTTCFTLTFPAAS